MVTNHDQGVFQELSTVLILSQTDSKKLQSVETVTPAAPGWTRVVTRGHPGKPLGTATSSLQG